MIEKKFKTIPFVMTKEEILETREFLSDRFKRARPFTGTLTHHHYEMDPNDYRYLIIKHHTDSTQFVRFKIFKD